MSKSLFIHISQALLNTDCNAPVEAHKASSLVSALCKAVDTTLNTPAHKDSKMLEEIKKLLNAWLDQHTDGPAFVNQWKNSLNHFKKNNIKIVEDLWVARAISLNGIEDKGYLQCKSYIAKNRNENLVSTSELIKSALLPVTQQVRCATHDEASGKYRSKKKEPTQKL